MALRFRTVTTVATVFVWLGCSNGSTDAATPLNDLGTGLYLNQFEGGLYPNGLNAPPAAHENEGLARAAAVTPLNTAGQPDPLNGKYVLLSIGMSNAAQEFAGGDSSTSLQPFSFMGQAAAYPGVNHRHLVLFNGARGGHTTPYFDSPDDPDYTRIQTDLANAGLSEAQVRAVWVKEANPGPTTSLPSSQADAYNLERGLGDIARALYQRYPNLQQVFFSSRTYGGYAISNLNPEPYAYETGFSVKWVIQSQINQMAGAGSDSVAGDLNYDSASPWLAWGPYLWADGMNPRSDGLTWSPDDFRSSDLTHPSDQGRAKVGSLMLNFFLNSEFTKPWFADPNATILPGDANNDGRVNVSDLGRLAAKWQQLGNWSMGDFNLDGKIDVTDLGILASHWQQSSAGGLSFDQALAEVGLGIRDDLPEPAALTVIGLSIACGRKWRQASPLRSIT